MADWTDRLGMARGREKDFVQPNLKRHHEFVDLQLGGPGADPGDVRAGSRSSAYAIPRRERNLVRQWERVRISYRLSYSGQVVRGSSVRKRDAAKYCSGWQATDVSED